MYGENGTLIRAHLNELLRHHRHAQHLAGAPVPGQPRPTSEQTLALVQQCVRYRNTILTWCLQAIDSVAPYAVPAAARPPVNPFAPHAETHGALIALRQALDAATKYAGQLPSLADLTSPQTHRLAECWRQAARGAALAEHDHPAGLNQSRLTPAQQQTLIADVAAIAQALVVLDRRNHRQAGWTPLPRPQRLGWAALACAMDAAMGPADYSVDMRGWAPQARLLRGTPPAGLPGVIHAEHNLLLRLNKLPTALNLRLVADSQRHLSTALAAIGAAHAPPLAAKWTERADTYSDLRRLLRDIGGNLGTGHLAVAEASKAVSRVDGLPESCEVQLRWLHTFDHLFDLVDTRISDIVEQGLRRRTYLPRHTLPELEVTDGHVIATPRQAYAPSADHHTLPVMELVTTRLRPPETTTTADSRDGMRSRAELHAGLVHRPNVSPELGPSL